MAILSNINDKFAVDSSGGIQFSGQTGTSGYVLKSNGNAAPTWVDGSTVIGGPYLPLSGGTLTGATATASGISFTVGGALTVDGTAVFNGDMTLPAAADHFLIGAGSLSTTSKIKFGSVTWNNSIGLESYWMVMRSNQNEGYKFIDSTGTVYVQFNAGNNSAGANYSYFKGRIGIGTTAPNAKLKIEGNGATNGLSIKSGGNVGTYPLMVTWTGGAEGDTFCVDAYLRVGIGTSSPGAQLHNYSTSATDVWISGYGTLAQNDWRAGHAMFVNTDNGLLISKANANNNTNRLFSFYNDANGYAQLYMYKGDSTAQVQIKTSGDSYFNGGNVGIGTTSPGPNSLSIHFDDSYGAYGPNKGLDVTNKTTTGDAGFVQLSARYNAGGANTFYHVGGIGGGKETALGDGQWGGFLSFFTTSDGTAGAASGMFEHMRITADGNVGIGTTSPSTKLSINDANYVEMATFSAASGATSGIVSNNSGYITSFITSATHQSSNTALFVPVTDGIKITKAGLLQVAVTQDFQSTGSSNYAQVQIRKNASIMFYSLRTNSNSQWDMLNSSGTMIVAANDIIKFYYTATDFLAMDGTAWSQYSFIWTSR